MTQHAYAQDQRPNAQQRRGTRPDATFKPVALPALAAAVQALRAQERRPAIRDHEDLPAILRKDAQLG
jgi:hypothetical protein